MERGQSPVPDQPVFSLESVTVLRPEAMATCGFVLVDSYGGVDATCA